MDGKFCKDCKHINVQVPDEKAVCYNDKNIFGVNYVNGKPMRHSCIGANQFGTCLYFESRSDKLGS